VRCLIALVWLVGWLSIAAGARADMQLGMESDEALKHDTAGYLARADGAGATWMRLTVGSSRWLTESDAYVNAAAAAQADGKRVLVTLMSWQQYPTPEAWAAFARQVVARMAPYVDAWSPLNEPNHWAMAPTQTVTCRLDASARTSTSEVRDGVRIERRWHRAPSGRWERIVEETHGKRPNVVVSFRRAAGGGWGPGPLRHISLLRPATIRVRTEWERHRCRAQADGVEYRELGDAVAPTLAQDADSRLVVGDLAPAPLDTVFLQAFYSRGAPDTEPEVLAIHPYDFGGPDAHLRRRLVRPGLAGPCEALRRPLGPGTVGHRVGLSPRAAGPVVDRRPAPPLGQRRADRDLRHARRPRRPLGHVHAPSRLPPGGGVHGSADGDRPLMT
jgi:hypothetical protein